MTDASRIGHLTVRYDDRVLRPRPWTAEQARWAAQLDHEAPTGAILELCAGVGHIGLLLASLVDRAVVLVDDDAIACTHARHNADSAGVDAEVRRAPVTTALAEGEEFAIVLADPPWVPTAAVDRYPDDPVTAIDGGPDGLDVARICVEVMGRHLADGGIGILQLGTVAQARTLAEELRGQACPALRVVEIREVPDANGVLVRLAGRRPRSPLGRRDDMVQAFYEALDEDRFRATELTRGPWDAGAQHAGPPSALLGTALEGALGGPLVRITIEILRPVPITDLTVSAALVRPGRSVAFGEATLADEDGPLLLARGWSIRREDIGLPAEVREVPDDVPGPAAATSKPFFDMPWDAGYHTAMDFRFVHGGFTEPGPSCVWMRPRQPLVAGTPLTPLQRVLVAADSGNGASSWFTIGTWQFINTDLTVHLSRYPEGEWVNLDARTRLEPDGVGLAQSVLRDERDVIGRGLQSLIVAAGTRSG